MKYFVSAGIFFCVFVQAQKGSSVVVEVVKEVIEKVGEPFAVDEPSAGKWSMAVAHDWMQSIQQQTVVDHKAALSYKNRSLSGKEYKWKWEWGYKHPISFKHGAASAQPELYGFKDMSVYFFYPLYLGWTGFAGVKAPVSSASRIKFLLLSSHFGVSRKWKAKNVFIEASSAAAGFWHRYKSDGMFFHPRLLARQMLKGEVDIQWIALSCSFILDALYDYNNDIHYEQSVDLRFLKKWNKKFNMFFGYSWTSSPRSAYMYLDQFYSTGIQAGFFWAV